MGKEVGLSLPPRILPAFFSLWTARAQPPNEGQTRVKLGWRFPSRKEVNISSRARGCSALTSAFGLGKCIVQLTHFTWDT